MKTHVLIHWKRAFSTSQDKWLINSGSTVNSVSQLLYYLQHQWCNTYIYVYLCACMYICMRVCMYVCVYVYLHACIYIYRYAYFCRYVTCACTAHFYRFYTNWHILHHASVISHKTGMKSTWNKTGLFYIFLNISWTAVEYMQYCCHLNMKQAYNTTGHSFN